MRPPSGPLAVIAGPSLVFSKKSFTFPQLEGIAVAWTGEGAAEAIVLRQRNDRVAALRAPDPGPAGFLGLPAGGQSGNPLSPHFADLLPYWQRGDGVPSRGAFVPLAPPRVLSVASPTSSAAGRGTGSAHNSKRWLQQSVSEPTVVQDPFCDPPVPFSPWHPRPRVRLGSSWACDTASRASRLANRTAVVRVAMPTARPRRFPACNLLVRHQNRYSHRPEDFSCGPAEDELPNARMPVGAHHQEINGTIHHRR